MTDGVGVGVGRRQGRVLVADPADLRCVRIGPGAAMRLSRGAGPPMHPRASSPRIEVVTATRVGLPSSKRRNTRPHPASTRRRQPHRRAGTSIVPHPGRGRLGRVSAISGRKPRWRSSKGLEGVAAAETKMSFIDGREGHPRVRRGSHHRRAGEQLDLEETVFLLWNTRLPKKEELASFTQNDPLALLRPAGQDRGPAPGHAQGGPADARHADADLFGHGPDRPQPQQDRRLLPSVRVSRPATLLAVAPTMLAAFHRYRQGKPLVKPDHSLPIAENFPHMLNGEPSRRPRWPGPSTCA